MKCHVCVYKITEWVKYLTSFFLWSSNQFDEPSFGLRTDLLTKFHQNQWLNPLRHTTRAANLCPSRPCCRSSRGLVTWWLLMVRLEDASSTVVTSCLTHDGTEKKNVVKWVTAVLKHSRCWCARLLLSPNCLIFQSHFERTHENGLEIV